MAQYPVPTDTQEASIGVKLYLGTTLVVLLLMMLAGLLMRAAQASWIQIPPDIFYQLMTVHGAGMVGIAGLAGSAIMWHFLGRYVQLNQAVLYINYGLFLAGVVLILGSVFVGGYAGGWTFLWPLPAKSMGVWSAHAAASFVGGLLLIGVGFLIFYLEAGIAITKKYGSVLRGLGIDQLISGQIQASHPPTVVASSMVIIVNTIGILSGAVVLAVTLANLYFPDLAMNALLAKNLIYFFGHVFINATIYMSVIAVYELLPVYAGRPWKVSRPFYAAWAAATVFVMAVYPHHLLMDMVMPKSLLVLGQIVSYLSGIPVLLVTTYGALVLVFESGIRWKAPALWLMLAMFGWAGGVIPAIVDGTIHVNKVMHNTMWVPGHFHFYLLLGVLPMVIGFSLHLVSVKKALNEGAQRLFFKLYFASGLAFCLAFLAGGWASVPRRWAQHLPEWLPYNQAATLAAVLVVVAMTGLVVAITRRLLERNHGTAA